MAGAGGVAPDGSAAGGAGDGGAPGGGAPDRGAAEAASRDGAVPGGAAADGAAREGSAPSLVVAGRVATLRLNRPRLHNRLSPGDLVALEAALGEAERDRSLRALVLTGSGRSFCSGFDIGALGGGGGGDSRGVSDVAGIGDAGRAGDAGAAGKERAFERLADQLERFRLPTICALNGSVYGGATDLALACDVRVGVAGMELLMPAARLGVHYYRGGLQRYVSRLGVSAAKRLFLLGEPQDTATLLRIGYLDEVVADAGALEARVQALVEVLCQRAPRAVQAMKRALNDIARGDADLMAIEAASLETSAELAEGRAAWLARRAPSFEDP